jgi:predicted amidohydrolase YtcJ
MNPFTKNPKEKSLCPISSGRSTDKHGGCSQGKERAFGIADLVQLSGYATSLAGKLDGTEMLLRGYIAPSLVQNAKVFFLTEGSQAPCLLCGCIHGVGAGILIELTDPSTNRFSIYEAVEVMGRIYLGLSEDNEDEVKLTGAIVQENKKIKALSGADTRQWLRSYLQTHSGKSGGKSFPQNKVQRNSTDKKFQENTIADIILRNGKFHLLDGTLNFAEAVAIKNGYFVAVGDEVEVVKHAGPDTAIVNLNGKCGIPGLIDSHLHQFFLAVNLPAVQLLDARSIADVQSRIAERVEITAPGDWVVGTSGWHESMLEEGHMPTRWDLDEVSPDNPVIIPRGGHVVTVNSLALERAGITNDTPDPVGGVIVRDPESGDATGVLLETASYFARRVAPPMPSLDKMAELLKSAMQELNSYGIVSVVDPVVDDAIMRVYRRLRDDDEITVRTDLLYKATDQAETRKGIAALQAETSDDMLRFVGVKFMLDGGVEGGRLREPYLVVPGEQPHADYHGLLMLPPGGQEEFVEALNLVADAGLQAQTHGVGDEAIDVIARAYALANQQKPIGDLRWTLMHAFLPSDEAIQTFLEVGVHVTIQNHPVLLGHNQRRWWGDERADEAIPVRKLIDSGLLVGGGTDGPIVPVDPFLSMWWMVTRGTLMGYQMGPKQAITAGEALALYTINNAKILGVEDDRGSIEVGKYADLVVLSQDILAVSPDEIRDTKALMTMVGGKIVYQNGI